jgi:2'-5' RNA ligase
VSPSASGIRTFLAVFPPAQVVEALAATIAGVARPGEGISWVKPANVHYTMRFLGDLMPARVEAAKRSAAAAVVGIAPFTLRLGGVGAFPNAARARVLWLGATAGRDELTLLAKSLDVALGREGFGRPDHPFAAHLTLGRVRDSSWASVTLAQLERLAWPELAFTVDALHVVKSTLDPKGSRYETLVRCALA